MKYGVIIDKGIQDWQVLQHKGGFGGIRLSGTWALPENYDGKARVHVRVAREDTGESVIPWRQCEHFAGKRWCAEILDIPAGGLYRIETCLNYSGNNWALEWGLRGDMVHHIGIGDIYVIAGQSNAAGYGKDPIYDPPEIGVHVLKNSGKWDLASHPLNDSTDTMHSENTEVVNPGHSPYIKFGKMLKRELGYPIGLVQTSLGGSSLSAWNPEENGFLYKNMMNIISICGRKIKGILWYQGCTDANGDLSKTYLKRFKELVARLRTELCNENLPFLTVQLNRSIAPGNESSDTGWGMVREAQREAARVIDNVFIIPSSDCPLSDDIHNSSLANLVIGERLGRTALKEIYHRNYICRAPDISRAKWEKGNRVRLIFDNVFGRLNGYGMKQDKTPFTVIDEDGKVGVVSCEAEDKNSLVITLERDLKGKSLVHGAYEQNPRKFLPFDIEGHLPMLSFYGVEIE